MPKPKDLSGPFPTTTTTSSSTVSGSGSESPKPRVDDGDDPYDKPGSNGGGKDGIRTITICPSSTLPPPPPPARPTSKLFEPRQVVQAPAVVTLKLFAPD